MKPQSTFRICNQIADLFESFLILSIFLIFYRFWWQKVYILWMTSLFFFVPFMILVVLYSTIARKLFKDTHIVNSKNDRISYANLRARKQVVLMLAAVILLFFLCLLPMMTLRVWSLFLSKVDVAKLGFEGYLNLLYFSRVMLYLNSALNPICYSLLSTKFRGSFRRALVGCQTERMERNGSCANTSPVFFHETKRRCRHFSSTSSTRFSTADSCHRCSVEDRSKFLMIKFEKKGSVPIVTNKIVETTSITCDHSIACKCIIEDSATWT